MKLPKLPRPMPQAAGFNRRRIAAAVIVVLGLLGAVTILLTRGSEREIVRTEPTVTAASTREPVELLDEPPPEPAPTAPPVLFELQAPADPAPKPVPERKVSARVQRAFSEPIPHASRRRASQRIPGDRPSGSVLPPELSAMFKDIDEQGRSLTRLLEQSPVVGGVGAAPGASPSAIERRNAPPPTAHREARRLAPSPYVLSQGTLISAQLLSEINSDLPGQVLAVVSRDVLDSVRSRHVLIPRGSRIIGEYASGLEIGQNRLAVIWKRFLLPDGSSIDVDGGFPAVDAQGRSGLHDRVNHHTARVFGNALVLSLLSAGFSAAQPDGGELRLSTGQLALQGAVSELEQAAGELIRRGGSIPPTVKIRAGQGLNVFLTGDLSFAAPYS